MQGWGWAVRKATGKKYEAKEEWGREGRSPGYPPPPTARPALKSFHSIKAPHSGSSCVPGLAAVAG